MAHTITAVIAITLIIFAVLTLTASSLSSASRISMAFEGLTRRNGDRARTELTVIDADPGGTGSKEIDITIRNTGQTALRDFSKWDVVIEYYKSSGNGDLRIIHAEYSSSDPPPDTEWTMRGIYIEASTETPEVYEPNIFNPTEEMIIRVEIGPPPIPGSTDNRVTIGVINGVTVSAPFSR